MTPLTFRERCIDQAVRNSLRENGGYVQRSNLSELINYVDTKGFLTGPTGFIIAHIREAFNRLSWIR